MKVWIHINGIQEGPFMIDNLPLDRMDADTPVWYNGLPDWMPAGQAPEVARRLLPQAPAPEAGGNEPQDQVDTTAEDNASAQAADDNGQRCPGQPDGPRDEGMRQPGQNGWQQPQGGYQQPRQQPWQPQQPYGQPMQPGWTPRQPYQQPQQAYGGYQPWRVPVGPDGAPLPCPPNYLVWSILLTVICCNPVGIVAIIYGWSVRSKFYSGDVEGARRASETTEWWVAISLVTGLIMTCCAGLII